jgi:hypothetical protein
MQIFWGEAVLDGRVVDISAEGMFVKTEKPLWIGARYAARIEVPDEVKMDCVVRRVEPFRGMAINYSVPDPAHRGALTATLTVLSRL